MRVLQKAWIALFAAALGPALAAPVALAQAPSQSPEGVRSDADAAAVSRPASAVTEIDPAKLTIPQIQRLLDLLSQRNLQVSELLLRNRELEREVGLARQETALRNDILTLAESRNRALFETGLRILDDYEAMRLHERIANREPLTQLHRVRLQNELQAFEDELAAHRFNLAREAERLETEAAPPEADPTSVSQSKP